MAESLTRGSHQLIYVKTIQNLVEILTNRGSLPRFLESLFKEAS